ncbi:MAG: glycosyltransferase family 9 protein [Candidatus Brocadiia bacterium]
MESIKNQQKIINIVGRTNVKQLAACIELCDLYISNDTGPMHLSVAMQTPTVGLFGPGNWQGYGTYPPEWNFRMIRADVDCWPCEDRHCKSRKCFKEISVSKVVETAEELLSSTR